ncbi:hypothetical protein ACJMK2_010961 [Sinanodonta woodiana]|uniref:Fucosyltransferase n=1 Tax=Sinanodonta woodiana TaxID=1069815 RepID=A0ABD3V5U7_SINWO
MANLFNIFFLVISRLKRKCKRNSRAIILSLLASLAVLRYMSVFTINGSHSKSVNQEYKTYFMQSTQRFSGTPKILNWTPFFGAMVWHHEALDCIKTCPWKCTLTDNKNEIASSDAVLFHLSDIIYNGYLYAPFRIFRYPSYRSKDQVWVVYNLESLSNLWGNFDSFNGLFNWTVTYRRESDIYLPNAEFRHRTEAEKLEFRTNSKTINFFRNKTKTAVAMISHCSDEARRYKLIQDLGKYIDIDIYGRCGKKCPGDFQSCDNLQYSYKFYLSFENSNCRDYVTEKFWLRQKFHQIPIVAWDMDWKGLVPPKSFINLLDFPDIGAAARYITQVGKNETLFNSYFDWQANFINTFECSMCKICKTLHSGHIPPQVYSDFGGWMKNDTCHPASISGYVSRVVDRFLFDARI